MKHNTMWTRGLSEQEKTDLLINLANGKKVLDKLKLICYNMLQESENVTKDDYDSPSWAYKAADRQGYRRALLKVIELCETKED